MSATSTPPPSPDMPLELSEVDVLTVLQALSDPVRLEIVRQLARCREGEPLMCRQFELPVKKSTASHHLKTLSRAGIVTFREEGTCKFVRLRRAEIDERFPGLLESVLRAASTDRAELRTAP